VALVLLIVFVGMPILELAVLLQVGGAIGVLNTVALLVLMGAVGSWLVKREGLGVLRRVQRAVGEGRAPGNELLDGFFVLLGGALMIAPGFVSDVLGISLMLPPVRAVLRPVVRRRIAGRRRGDAGFLDLP
jgi:UPF0716 protein FxsA